MKKFGELETADFLKDYWQKKPYLAKNIFPQVADLIDENELAGLALDEDVDSRLIRWEGTKTPALDQGPFTEDVLSNLPQSPWSLLVCGVENYIPDADKLLRSFSFIPNWRVDDIMVSYSNDKGGVGPHLDNYDVFLIQGKGRKRWTISEAPILDDDFLPDCPLRILKSPYEGESFITEPGDVLSQSCRQRLPSV